MIHVGYLVATATALMVMLIVTVGSKNRWIEGTTGIACSGLLLLIHATSIELALHDIERLLPTVLFLGFCLSFARLCEKERLFDYLGHLVGNLCRGNPRLLFILVFALSATVTSVLSLDATVLLLTPIVLQAAFRLGFDYRPFAYETGHLANTASMLLPISNLTNLLLVAYANISFLDFIRLSWLPWVAALIAEFLTLFVIFHRSLSGSGIPRKRVQDQRQSDRSSYRTPTFALLTVALTLIGFVVTGMFDIAPFWVALAGCATLMAWRCMSEKTRLSEELHTAWKSFNVSFLIFVLSLSVVVASLADNGIRTLLLPAFHQPVSLASLLMIAAVSVVASNIMNNLPAAMLLIPIAASQNPMMAMAVLIGVNLGPNLTYVGSLANILWRRILLRTGKKVELLQFSWIGLVTTSLCIVSSIVALWVGGTGIVSG
ncbi:SLC13 family permease [Bifidobacterium sp.]|uniref:SLC13 family permease n=1 Tax=Bifidobacterium sp. TaxID=41200 RepID=UPI0039EC8E57